MTYQDETSRFIPRNLLLSPVFLLSSRSYVSSQPHTGCTVQPSLSHGLWAKWGLTTESSRVTETEETEVILSFSDLLMWILLINSTHKLHILGDAMFPQGTLLPVFLCFFA